MPIRRLLLVLLLAVGPLAAEDFVRLDFKPFYMEIDVGASNRDKQKAARRLASTLSGNLKHFQSLFGLKAKDFEEYAKFYGADEGNFERNIRIRVWSSFDEFLKDFQTRYETKARAGGFSGIIYPKDSDGNRAGPGFREISLHMDGITEKEALRTLLHEFGHLFMRTYIKYSVEVPSWLEEGAAQLWEYRSGNGTKPEAAVRERLAWLYEMTCGEEDDFVTYPTVSELIEVRNAHNLDFTHENPLRSVAQYTMVWGMAQFLTQDPRAYQAFKKMLGMFKESAHKRFWGQVRAGKRGESLHNAIHEHLYSVQAKIIEECFGANFEEIGEAWEKWIEKTYEKMARRQPEMLFHRALYHSRIRARFAPDRAWYDKCIARANELLSELEEEDPEEALVDVGRAMIAQQHGDWATARKLYKQARERGSERLEVLIYSAGAMIREGKAEQVVEDLEDALEEAPGNALAQGYLGQALLIIGEDYDDAAGLLRQAHTTQPERPELGTLAGFALMLDQEDEKAFYEFAGAFQDQKQKDWLSAAFIVLLAQRGNVDRDPVEWIERVKNADAELGEKVKAIWESGKQLQPGFSPEGELGFVGVNLDPETAIVPPDKPKRGGLFRRR